MEDDWGLQAVVRGCSTATPVAAMASQANTPAWCSDPFQNSNSQQVKPNQPVGFPDLFKPRVENSIEYLLRALYKPIDYQKSQTGPIDFRKSQKCLFDKQISPVSPLSVLGGLQDQSAQQQLQQQRQIQFQGKQAFGGSRCTATNAHGTRPKKRKNQLKRVCQVPAEGLSSDMWSWRKYGQKPIKSSPYPRGYYRCSTSKGCLARKQVERNRSDPNMFIITYTGDHNHPMPTHRNSLAGSTRQKPVESGDGSDKPSLSPTTSPACSLSPTTEKVRGEDPVDEDDDDEEENEFGVSVNTAVNDDFFEGLEDLIGSVAGDSFHDHFSPSSPFPWSGNSAATAAAGNG